MTSRRLLALFTIAVIVSFAPTRQSTAQQAAPALQPELPSGWIAKTTQYADRDMVAAANPLAVDAGYEILGKGGSAVDAAIAVQMVLTLAEPQSSGIGGGAFMMHYDGAKKSLIAYDGRETAPAAATPDLFFGPDRKPLEVRTAIVGGLSVGTPGVLRLLERAHAQHGKLPWPTLFQRAINLAEHGFVISPRLEVLITGAAKTLCEQPVAARYFLKAGCQPRRAGETLKNPELAATLRAIAQRGASAFYSGDIADAIVKAVHSHPTNPGRLSIEDLKNYSVKEREPVCGRYRGLKICGMPPPNSGTIAVLQTLGVLEHHPVASFAPNSADAVHLITEAYRLAYADRNKYVGDADFVRVPVAGMLDPEYLKQRSTLIRMDRTMGAAAPGTPAGAEPRGMDDSPELPSTSHLSIVDRFGNAIAMTTTIESVFGSMQMTGGFLLNNQLTDFSLSPADAQGNPVANRVEAGKRPRSSMSPVVIFGPNDTVEGIIGSPGGSNIIQYVTKTVIGLVDWKLDIQNAIDLPNFGAQASTTTELEKGTPLAQLQDALKARGHNPAVIDINSGLQGIVFNGLRDGRLALLAREPARGRWAGGADPRREGIAKGHR
jgi:gamma-glutamyltranspeptidase/glutathione hydrolase